MAERNRLDIFCAIHGRYPKIRTANDRREKVEVTVTPGYVEFKFFGDPLHGNPHHRSFYVTRNAWLKILRFSLPLMKYMDRQFSVPLAMTRAYEHEQALDQAARQEKRARRSGLDSSARRRARRRA